MIGGIDLGLGLLINILSAAIAIDFMDRAFGRRYQGWRGTVFFLIGATGYFGTVTFLNSVMVFEGLIGLFYGFVMLLYACLVLKGKWQYKVILSFLWNVIALVSAYMMFAIMGAVSGSELEHLLQSNGDVRVYMALGGTIMKYVLGRVAVAVYKKLKGNPAGAEEWAVTISTLLIYILSVAMFTLERGGLEQRGRYYLSIGILTGFVFILICIIYFYHRVELHNRKRQELQYEQNRLKREEEHTKQVIEAKQELSGIKHDIMDFLSLIDLLMQRGREDEVKEKLKTKIGEVNRLSALPQLTGNVGMDIVVDRIIQLCKEKEIEFAYTVHLGATKRDEEDMQILFSNLLKNVVEACEKVEGERFIDFHVESQESKLYCIMQNSIRESVLDTNPELQTNKEDKRNHGYGTMRIQKIIRKYNGSCEYKEKNGIFIQEIMLNERFFLQNFWWGVVRGVLVLYVL